MPCVAHLMLVMLRLPPFVAHLMLVMVLNMPEQCSFQDLLFHLLFTPKYDEKSASRRDITLRSTDLYAIWSFILWRTTLEGASWVGRISCVGGLFVAGAGAGLAEAGTDVVSVVVADEVVPFEAAFFRPMVGVSCVGTESLGRPQGREEPSMKGVPNLPDREVGLLANVERSLEMSWVSQSWSCTLCGTSLG